MLTPGVVLEATSNSSSSFFEHPLVSIAEVNEEIAAVVFVIHQVAAATIPPLGKNLMLETFSMTKSYNTRKQTILENLT